MRSSSLLLLLAALCPVVLPHYADEYIEDILEDELHDFYDEYSEEDEETGGALRYTAKGKMSKDVINVDEHQHIRKVKCELDETEIVLVALYPETDENVTILEPGMILFGGSEWGCPSTVNKRPWDGLLRKVRSVGKRTPTVLEVDTEPAEFMDLFEHAHMKYHYRPGARNNPKIKHRSKRGAGGSSAGLSVAQWVTMIDYNVQTGSPIELSDTRTVVFETPNPDVPYSFTCEDCSLNMTFGLTFELEKPQDDPITHYKLRLNGTMGISQTVHTSIGTTLSKAGQFKSPQVVNFTDIQSIPFSIPPEAGLPPLTLKISVNIRYEGMVDAKAKVGQDITHVVSMAGDFDLDLDITDGSRSEPVYTFAYTPTSSSAQITAMDVRGRGNIGMVINPVVEVIPRIQWEYAQSLHWFNIQSKFHVMIKPQFTHIANVEDSIVCLETLIKGLFTVSNDDVLIDVTIFANPAGFWVEDLNSFDLEYDEVIMEEIPADCGLDSCCVVDCFGPEETPDNDLSMDEVVGVVAMVPEPDLLEVTGGADYVLAGAKSKFSGRFALFLLKLIKFVAAYRPGSKLILKLGYNVNQPVYNEGRAAEVQFSAEGSDAPDSDTSLLPKLSQLAVCVGFEYAKVKGNAVEIGAMATPTPSPSRTIFEETLDLRANLIDGAECANWPDLFPELSVGETNPADSDAISVCGGVDDPISRMEPDSFSGFYCYQFNDVSYKDEEKDAAWCLSDSRICFPCDPDATEPYKYCADCVMSLYLAFCMRRWATIVNSAGGSLKIVDAWVEPTADREIFIHHLADITALNMEGRAAYVEVSGLSVGKASSLASCASFDFVEVIDASTIYVAVRKSSRDGLMMVPFVNGPLIAVDTPVTTDNFNVHESFANEKYKVHLFDSHGMEEHEISQYFHLKDFLYPLTAEKDSFERYFRLDPHLVYCLDLIQWNTPKVFEIKTGYKPIGRNLYGLDERHPNELYRYVNGQAAEIAYAPPPPEDEALDWYVDLGKRILRRCAPLVRSDNLGFGVGVYRTHLYVHVYENPEQNGKVSTQAWLESKLNETVENEKVDDILEQFERMEWQLNYGAPEVSPMDEASVCDNHPLTQGGEAEWKGFMSYRMAFDREACQDEEWTDFCVETEPFREEVYQKVKSEILMMATPDNRLHEYFFQGLKGCYLRSCGVCAGDGPTWANKVHNCTDVARFFFQYTAHDSFYNNFNFFNDESLDEDMRDLACGAVEQLCKSKTSGYSILSEPLHTLYTPGDDPTLDVQEYVYGSASNPMPNIVDQATAMEVSGNVTVWMSDKEDWEALKKVIRVLMVYNNMVEYVHFKFLGMPEQDVAIIRESLQRFMDIWAGNACPRWSRASVAPFTTEIIADYQNRRRKREVSPAEYLRRKKRNWELEWIMRN